MAACWPVEISSPSEVSGGLDAEPQVGERGLDQDGHGHGDGGVDDDRPGGVGQQVPEHDPGVAGPQRPGRLHELLLAQGQEGAAHHPGDVGPLQQRQHQPDEEPVAGLVGHGRGQHGQDGDRRDGQDQVGEAHQGRVDPAAVVAGQGPDDRPEGGRQDRHHQRHLDRLLGAAQHLGQRVVADVVGPHRVLQRRRRGELVGDVGVAVLPEAAADQRDDHHQQEHHQAADGQLVGHEPADDHLGLAAPGDRELALGGGRRHLVDLHAVLGGLQLLAVAGAVGRRLGRRWAGSGVSHSGSSGPAPRTTRPR